VIGGTDPGNACPADISNAEVKKRTYLMLLALQGAFLRSALLKNEIWVDFFDQQQREALVDSVVDFYLRT
jgi:predicted transcriptional regulator YdeE